MLFIVIISAGVPQSSSWRIPSKILKTISRRSTSAPSMIFLWNYSTSLIVLLYCWYRSLVSFIFHLFGKQLSTDGFRSYLVFISIVLIDIFIIFSDESNVDDNKWAGILCIIFFLLIISVLSFPNGPFTRPHPAVWRMVFGLSILYLLSLLFLLFQDYKTARGIFLWIDPKLNDFHIDMDKVLVK